MGRKERMECPHPVVPGPGCIMETLLPDKKTTGLTMTFLGKNARDI